jgi:ABC-2 type transport system ATP-binding protein
VLFFDEPTVGVDPHSRNLLLGNIEALKGKGHTILYTTHYMEEAQRLCDRVAIMDNGRVLALDTVSNLIKKHGGLSVITVELEAEPESMDSIPGTLEGTTLRIETATPLKTIAGLGAVRLKIQKMNMHHSDLETVFLNLTGRSLRDQ